jgi:hypothetical protein
VIQSSKDAAYLARTVGLRVGVPIEKPAVTVNRLCGSGFEAVVEGARVSHNLLDFYSFCFSKFWLEILELFWPVGLSQ